jgi:predicted nucleotidyltransferase
MKAVAIRRESDYHDQNLTSLPSAAAVRAAFNRGDHADAMKAIPAPARPFAEPDALHGMDDMLMLTLRDMSPEDIAGLPDVGEGLEHRLYRLCIHLSLRLHLHARRSGGLCPSGGGRKALCGMRPLYQGLPRAVGP